MKLLRLFRSFLIFVVLTTIWCLSNITFFHPEYWSKGVESYVPYIILICGAVFAVLTMNFHRILRLLGEVASNL